MKFLKISHREKDYNSLSDAVKVLYFFIKKQNIIRQVVDRIKWNLLPIFFCTGNFPTHIDIESSVSCQMACPMCLRHTMPEALKNGIMELKLYKKIIDEASKKGTYSVKLSWRGEPILNPNIIEMVKYAKTKGIKDVAFLTNGQLLSREVAMGLVDCGLDWISFSVDGLNGNYEKIRRPEKFKSIVEKIKFLKHYRENRKKSKPLIRIQAIWGAIKHDPTPFFDFWNDIADKICIIADQVRGDLVVFPREKKYICYEPWRRITIGWDGQVSQCISDYEQNVNLGNVSTHSIQEIWNGDSIVRLRKSIREGHLFDNKPCSICHDPGQMYTKTVMISGKKYKINLYKGQEIDVSKF